MTVSPLVIAHRGASGYRPEHSREAYLLAIEQNADAIEPDVVVSKDGVLVVRHENELSASTDIARRIEFASRYRTAMVAGETKSGWFAEDFTWDELSTLQCAEPMPRLRPESAATAPTPILRLADVLAIADSASGSLSVVVELKDATHFADLGLHIHLALERELEVAGWKRDDPRLILESFELAGLKACREEGLGTSHIYLMDTTGTAPDQLKLGANAPSYEDQRRLANMSQLALAVNGISIPVDLLCSSEGAQLLARCHDLGMVVYTWTLRPENRFLPHEYRIGFDTNSWGNWSEYFDVVLATGVDGVFVDHPDLVTARA